MKNLLNQFKKTIIDIYAFLMVGIRMTSMVKLVFRLYKMQNDLVEQFHVPCFLRKI